MIAKRLFMRANGHFRIYSDLGPTERPSVPHPGLRASSAFSMNVVTGPPWGGGSMIVMAFGGGHPDRRQGNNFLGHDVNHPFLILKPSGDYQRGLQVDHEAALLE